MNDMMLITYTTLLPNFTIVYFLCRSYREWLWRWQWCYQLWLSVGQYSAGVIRHWCQFTFGRKDNICSVFCWICQVCSWWFIRCCPRYTL